MQRLRPLSEAECYLRCYGWTGDDDAVRVVHPASPDVRADATAAMTERIRLAFESRFVGEDAEAA